MQSPSATVDAIDASFAAHEVASLRLPSGWFGRPHDNMHQLLRVEKNGDRVLVTLDERQVLTLDAIGVSLDGRTLRIEVRSGSWDWVEYGGSRKHSEHVGTGHVEFHTFKGV